MLKHRTRPNTAIKTELLDKLKALAKEQNKPLSKLLDSAVEEYLRSNKKL